MSYVWLDPKTWKAGEGLTPSKLNTYLRDQQNYLRYRNRVEATDTTDITMTNVTFAALDDNKFKLSHSIAKNADILLRFVGQTTSTVVTNESRFDIFIDDSYYLSSLIATALTRGLFTSMPYAITVDNAIDFQWTITGLSEGTHTFSLHNMRSAATTVLKGTTRTTRFSVEDY